MARPSPTVRRRRLRSELRRLRTELGLTIEDVQERTGGDIRVSTLSLWETGERSVRPNDLRALLDVYGLAEGQERETLLTLCRQAKERGWWQAYGSAVPGWFQVYVGLESEACEIRQYSAELVPGLLQSPCRLLPGVPHHVAGRCQRQPEDRSADGPAGAADLN